MEDDARKRIFDKEIKAIKSSHKITDANKKVLSKFLEFKQEQAFHSTDESNSRGP